VISSRMPRSGHGRGYRGRARSRILSRLFNALLGNQFGQHRRHRRRHHAEERTALPLQNTLTPNMDDRTSLVPKPMNPWRALVFSVLALGLIWLAWDIIAQTVSFSYATTNPQAALKWNPHQSAALNMLARQELVDPDANLDLARGWAQRALRYNPLDTQSLVALALIAEKKGDKQNAADLMQIAGARTWRDEANQLWLFKYDARRGDFMQALTHLDAILRVDMNAKTRFFLVLASFTVEPQTLKALTSFLATAPPWREWFLSQLSLHLINVSRLTDLYTALAKTDHPPTTDELRPYISRLIDVGQYKQAYATWINTLPAALRPNKTYPYNRDFTIPVDDEMPFNWVLREIPGEDVQIVPSPDGGRKRVLRAQFSGARVIFAGATQLLMLPPGDYRFSGRVKADDLRTTRGLWWRIYCAGKSGATLAQTKLVSGTIPWTEFTAKFQVPAADCQAQWLQMELPARIPSEGQISGQVWYQYLAITPTPSNENQGALN
jgi:tetratricopeptide (TPR) repeat protein